MKKIWEAIKTAAIWLWTKNVEFWKSVWEFIKSIFKQPADVIFPTIIAELVFWIPLWVPAILALTISPWWWTVCTGVIAFWAGPFTPAMLLQFGLITIFIKIWKKIRGVKEEDPEPEKKENEDDLENN